MPERFRQIAGAAVAPQIRHDELESASPFPKRCLPVLARAGEAVEQEKRLPRSMDFKVELHAVKTFHSARRPFRLHSPCSFFPSCSSESIAIPHEWVSQKRNRPRFRAGGSSFPYSKLEYH